MHNRKKLNSMKLYFGGEWVRVGVGEHIPIGDGIYIGATGSAVVYGETLVAAWSGISHIIPHGTPEDWKKLSGRPTHIDNLVAHITMDSLKEGASREHLDWEKDCVPNLTELLENLSLQIEPIHLCMMACNKLKRKIEY